MPLHANTALVLSPQPASQHAQIISSSPPRAAVLLTWNAENEALRRSGEALTKEGDPKQIRIHACHLRTRAEKGKVENKWKPTGVVKSAVSLTNKKRYLCSAFIANVICIFS